MNDLWLGEKPWKSLKGKERAVAIPSKAAPFPKTSRLLIPLWLLLFFEPMITLRLVDRFTVQGDVSNGKTQTLRTSEAPQWETNSGLRLIYIDTPLQVAIFFTSLNWWGIIWTH